MDTPQRHWTMCLFSILCKHHNTSHSPVVFTVLSTSRWTAEVTDGTSTFKVPYSQLRVLPATESAGYPVEMADDETDCLEDHKNREELPQKGSVGI